MQTQLTPKTLLWLNTLGYLGMLLASFEGATGFIGGKTIPMIGAVQGNTLLTPAPYAFSIWGLIYLLLLGYIVFQWRQFKANDNSHSLLPSGLWFAISCVFYVTWILTWINGFIWLPLITMAGIVFCLWQLVKRLNLQLGQATKTIVWQVWYPIAIYIGWVTLALGVNTSVVFKFLFPNSFLFSPTTWALIALAVLISVYILYIRYRNMRETALVGVWGFIAVAVEQWSASPAISLFALVVSAILVGAVAAHYRSHKFNIIR
ncbi:MAG: hypothetical protein E6Q83_13885 [Thiothrix sp.]|nr:MAG: hypothetical protein E6Q83_13885 [Thiothrix sp.]